MVSLDGAPDRPGSPGQTGFPVALARLLDSLPFLENLWKRVPCSLVPKGPGQPHHSFLLAIPRCVLPQSSPFQPGHAAPLHSGPRLVLPAHHPSASPTDSGHPWSPQDSEGQRHRHIHGCILPDQQDWELERRLEKELGRVWCGQCPGQGWFGRI